MQVIGWAAREADAFAVSCVQFAVTGASALVASQAIAAWSPDAAWAASEAIRPEAIVVHPGTLAQARPNLWPGRLASAVFTGRQHHHLRTGVAVVEYAAGGTVVSRRSAGDQREN